MRTNLYSKWLRTSFVKAFALGVFATMLSTASWGQYCVPATNFGCGFGDQITSFSTTLGTSNITNNGTTCSAGNYSYTTAQNVGVAPGGSFDFSVQCGPTFSQGTKIWIDFNNDLDFDDPGENVFTSTTWTTAVVTGTITVPAGTAGGIKRMRVRCSYNSIPTSPCANQTYGEVEDYDVDVSVPFANDAGISAIDSPAAPVCVITDSIWVSITNFGTSPLTSADIKWSYNGGAINTYAWTGNLAPNMTDGPINVGNTPLTSGNNIDVWTEMPNNVPDSNIINDSNLAAVPQPSLNGTYSLGTGQTYLTFQDAVDDLEAFGVCGPVVFNVMTGTYNEQIEINDILGASSVNTIIFQSVAQDSSTVTLTSSTAANATNWTVAFNGADWVTFQHLTIENTNTLYGRVFSFAGSSNNNAVMNSVVRNNNATTTSTFSALVYSNNSEDNGTHFKWNVFENGSYGLYWWGVSQTALETGTEIEGNLFKDQYRYGMYTYYQDGLKIHNNLFESTSTYTGTSYAISNWYSDNGTQITQNVIKPSGNTYPVYGIQHYYGDNTAGSRGLVANNCIRVGNSTNTGTSFYGFYGFQNGFVDIINNTMDIEGGGVNARALYSSSGGANTMHNNSLSNMGQGYAVYLQDNYTVIDANNNNLYTTANNFAWQGGSVYGDLAAWQAGSNFDLNGVSVNPDFLNIDNCRICQDTLDAAAFPSALATVDYQGNTRSTTTPDIGASEFTGVANFSLGNDPIFCGGAGTLDAGPVQSAIWSTGATTTSINVTTSGTYNVSILTDCGPASSSVIATVVPVPDLGPDMHICANQTANLDATVTGAPSYVWNTGDTNATFTATMAGTYDVTVTNSGCVDVTDVVITQSEAVSLPEEAEACDGNSIDLDATIQDGLVYTWTPAFSGAVNNVTASGNYSVVVTDSNGCVSEDTTDVSIVTVPVASFTSFLTFQTGTFLNTSPSTGGVETYDWDFGDMSPNSPLENPVHLFPWPSPGGDVWIVSLTVTNDCGTNTVTQQVSISTGIEENIASNGFSFFPNPNNGNFTLVMKDAKYNSAVMDIVDLQGRVVYTEDLGLVNGELTQQMQLNDLSKGVYFIRMTLDNEVKIDKLNIQ